MYGTALSVCIFLTKGGRSLNDLSGYPTGRDSFRVAWLVWPHCRGCHNNAVEWSVRGRGTQNLSTAQDATEIWEPLVCHCYWMTEYGGKLNLRTTGRLQGKCFLRKEGNKAALEFAFQEPSGRTLLWHLSLGQKIIFWCFQMGASYCKWVIGCCCKWVVGNSWFFYIWFTLEKAASGVNGLGVQKMQHYVSAAK